MVRVAEAWYANQYWDSLIGIQVAEKVGAENAQTEEWVVKEEAAWEAP